MYVIPVIVTRSFAARSDTTVSGVSKRTFELLAAIVVDPRVAHARYLIVPREVATKLEAHVASSLCFLAGR